jgi:tRNA U55 pseudouridine synthase TruB
VRSIAEALGGHCLTLRRTAVGPFNVDEASTEMILPSRALERLPEEAVARIPRTLIDRVLAVEAEELRAA